MPERAIRTSFQVFARQTVFSNSRVAGIAKTDDGQFLNPIDAKTLATIDDKDKGFSVRPENIHLALREFAGVADHPFSEKFPFVIPKEQRLHGFWG